MQERRLALLVVFLFCVFLRRCSITGCDGAMLSGDSSHLFIYARLCIPNKKKISCIVNNINDLRVC